MRNRLVRNFVIYSFIAIMLFPLLSLAVYAVGNMGATDGISRPVVGTATVDTNYRISATDNSIVGDYVQFLGNSSDSTVGKPVFRYSYDFIHGVLGASSTVSVMLSLFIVYEMTIMAILVIITIFTFPIMILSER